MRFCLNNTGPLEVSFINKEIGIINIGRNTKVAINATNQSKVYLIKFFIDYLEYIHLEKLSIPLENKVLTLYPNNLSAFEISA